MSLTFFTFKYDMILKIIIDLLSFLIFLISCKVNFVGIRLFFKNVVICVAMVTALKGIGMSETKIFVKYNSATTLLADIFVPIFCFHVFPGKYALLELKVDAILAQYFRK